MMNGELTTPEVQLRHALFEAGRAMVGNERLIERLAVGLLTGRPILVGGPHGVGKCLAARTMARVFGLGVTVRHATDVGGTLSHLDEDRLNVVTDLEAADIAAGNELAAVLGRPDPAMFVATVGDVRPSRLSRRIRDEMLMFVEVPYPEPSAERLVARHVMEAQPVDSILQPSDLAALRRGVARVGIDDPTLDYAVRLVQATRAPAVHGLNNLSGIIREGASPRATIGLVRAARGLAVLRGRPEVEEQDVYDVAYDVLVHRVELMESALQSGIGAGDVLVELLSRVPARLEDRLLS